MQITFSNFPSPDADERASGSGSHFVRDGFNGEMAVHVHRCMTPGSESRYSLSDGSRYGDVIAALGSYCVIVVISVYF